MNVDVNVSIHISPDVERVEREARRDSKEAGPGRRQTRGETTVLSAVVFELEGSDRELIVKELERSFNRTGGLHLRSYHFIALETQLMLMLVTHHGPTAGSWLSDHVRKNDRHGTNRGVVRFAQDVGALEVRVVGYERRDLDRKTRNRW